MFVHKTVSHSINFVDPGTEPHLLKELSIQGLKQNAGSLDLEEIKLYFNLSLARQHGELSINMQGKLALYLKSPLQDIRSAHKSEQ